MRIVIVGPGALGCLFAGLLSKVTEVWLLDRDPQRAERIIQNAGISSSGISGKWKAKIPATAQPQDIGQADLVVICTKSYDTQEAINHAKALVGPQTYVLTLQNGLGNLELISEVVDSEQVLAGITHHATILKSEGCIEHTGTGETIIGSPSPKPPKALKDIRAILNKAGIKTKISENIQGALWSKLIMNSGINALAAITRLKNGELIKNEGAFEVLSAAISESAKVAKRKRIKLLYDDPQKQIMKICRSTSENMCSMLQDVLSQKPTEVDFINGVIVREGKKYGMATPMNFALYKLVRAIETSYPTG